jgi:nitrogen-specific signal transduction histidine kinase/CheY-like chemotaxis protein
LKDKLARLVPAIERELRESEMRRERRDLEEQLRHAQKLESLGVLAGGVAHDFNNLLTGILGNASLALEVLAPPEPARTMLHDVIRASERAADLTRQLLAYAGKGQFVIQRVHLSELVRDIADLIRSSIPRLVELRMELSPNLPPIDGDASQIQQLVMNLVLNAGEAIGNSHGTVLVRTAPFDVDERGSSRNGNDLPPGRYVMLEVEDTGCGMEERTVAHIFDPFYTTKFTGRGLGLAAAQGIVRAHKGSIRVISAPNIGSTFRILLPGSAVADLNQPARAQAASAASLAGSGTVLVVDDESIVRRTVRASLERYGYQVAEAAHGREALDLLHTHGQDYSLIVLDLMMPVMGGEETFEELKRIRPEIPVILSSGYDEQEATSKFKGKSIAGFIQKPYTAARLAEKIKKVLGNAAPAASGL